MSKITDAHDLREQLLRAECAEIDRRIRAGESIRVEEVTQHPDKLKHDPDWAIELIYVEFVARCEIGETPKEESYYERFPTLASRLREQFQIHHLLAQDEDVALLNSSLNDLTESELWLGRYRVQRECGRGAMGVVYLALDIQLKRSVAIKILRAGEYASESELERLHSEAQSAARLQHPNIVQVYEIGDEKGCTCLVMEYVDAGTLQQLQAVQPLNINETAALVERIARAIHFAHQQGIIHRDLKPSNILVNDEVLKIADFGLAKSYTEDELLHQSRAFVGTPGFMAPEQLGGGEYLGPASDVYSLGAILYELLTGRPPFAADTLLETARQIAEEDPVAPRKRRPKIPFDLEVICLKSLEKDPYKRYATADALAEDLARYQAGLPIVAKPISTFHATMKWVRRHPTLTALFAVLLISTISVLSISMWYTGQLQHSNQELTSALNVLEQERQRANANHQETLKQNALYLQQLSRAQRGRYALQLNQVLSLWERDPTGGMQLLMDEDACPIELRDFTWHYCYRLCNRMQRLGDSITESNKETQWDLLTTTPDDRFIVANSASKLIVMSQSGKVLSEREIQFTPVCMKCDDSKLWIFDDAGVVRCWAFPELTQVGKPFEILAAHTKKNVSAVAFNLRQAEIVVGTSDGKISIWSLATGKEKQQWQADEGEIVAVAWSPNGARIASAGQEKRIQIWNIDDVSLMQELTDLDHAHCLEFIDESRLVSAGRDERIKFWDLTTGKLQSTLTGHTGPVHAICYSQNTQTLASGSTDKTVRLWDVTTQQETLMFKGHLESVKNLSFNALGTQLISSSSDSLLRWQLKSPAMSQEIPAHLKRITAVAFSDDGRFLATGANDMTISVWDRKTNSLRRFEKAHKVRGLFFSTDGKHLISASEDKLIRKWNLESGNIDDQWAAYSNRLFAIATSNDQTRLAVVGNDNNAQIWNIPEQKLLHTFVVDQQLLTAVALSSDGSLLATGSREGVVRVWNVSTAKPLYEFVAHQNKAHGDWVHGLTFSPNDLTLASASADTTVRTWNIATGEPELILRGHSTSVLTVAYTPDGKTLMTSAGERWVSAGGEVKLWDAETGHVRATFSGMNGPLAISPKGTAFAIGSQNGIISVFETEPFVSP